MHGHTYIKYASVCFFNMDTLPIDFTKLPKKTENKTYKFVFIFQINININILISEQNVTTTTTLALRPENLTLRHSQVMVPRVKTTGDGKLQLTSVLGVHSYLAPCSL